MDWGEKSWMVYIIASRALLDVGMRLRPLIIASRALLDVGTQPRPLIIKKTFIKKSRVKSRHSIMELAFYGKFLDIFFYRVKIKYPNFNFEVSNLGRG